MIPGLPWDRPSHRTVPRARVIETLVAHGWLFDALDGRHDAARDEADAALERLLSLGLPQQDGQLDPVEVLNGFRAAGRAGLDATWQDRLVPNARQLVARGPQVHQPPDLGQLADRTYRVSVQRDYHLPAGSAHRLRLPLPLDPTVAADLACRSGPADIRRGHGWADFRLTVPANGEVSCRADLTVTAQVQGPDGAILSPDDRDLYCRPLEGLILVTPRVEALASQLAGSQGDPRTVVRCFLDFLRDQLRFGSLAHNQIDPSAPADLVLDGGWYDCMAGSALLASLCRSQGIPARLVWGYGLYEAGSGAHNWIEIWFEGAGWTPFDLASLELGADGQDPDWSELFLGQLDHRMVVERLPRQFAGLGSLKLPPAWHLLSRVTPLGLVHDVADASTGHAIYSESLEVTAL